MKPEINSLLLWKKIGKSYPVSIEIHPTNMCNLNCIMCGTKWAYRRKKELNPSCDINEDVQFEVSKKRWLSLIKEAYELGIRRWLITGGGEPMLRKDVVLSLVKEIKYFGMYGNINTNGVLFDKKDVQTFVNNQWDMVMFSLDSADESVHDKIRGMEGAYNRTLTTIKMFNDFKKKRNISKPKLTFNTLLCNKNYKGVEPLIQLASESKCTDITFIPLIRFGDFKKELSLTRMQQDEFQKKIPSLIDFAEKKKINTNLNTFERDTFDKTSEMNTVILSHINKKEDEFLSIPCYEPFLNLVVRMDGKISPCCMLENHKENIKNKSLKEVWFGHYFTALREQLFKGNLPQGCETCVHSRFVHNKVLRDRLRKSLS